MTDDERSLINTSLLAAREERPYYSRAIAALQPVARPGLNTIAVDRYWQLYIDLAWFFALPLSSQAHIICAHEVEHLLRGHDGRGAPHDDKIAWNMACDAEINDDADIELLPPGVVTPARLGAKDGLLAEDYVDYAAAVPKSRCCGGGSGAGNPLPDEQAPDESCVSEDQAEILRDAVAADVRAHVAKNGIGSLSPGLLIWANARAVQVTPIPWTARFAATVKATLRTTTSSGCFDYGSALSRRQLPNQPLRRKMVKPNPTVGIVVDTSRSMGDAGALVLGAVQGIVRKHSKVICYQIDTEVKNRTNGVPRSWTGGGGTDLRSAIKVAAEECDVVVVVTDGETPWPDAVRKSVVVLCTTDAVVPLWVASCVRIKETSQ